MQDLSPFLPIIFFSLSLSLSFFLNYVSALYSEADLFKIDLTKKNKGLKSKKLFFVLKNGQLLFAIVSVLQVFLNIFMSTVFLERVEKEVFEIINKYVVLIFFSLFIALFTEIFTRYLGNKPFSKRLIQSNFFIDFAYLLLRPFSFLRTIVKPKKKIFTNSENDVIRFINNLAVENILEKKEALLIQSALNFDEFRVNLVFVPRKKVIFLNENMSFDEVQNIYLKHFFTRYPVFNKEKEVIGIFNLKRFYWSLIKNKNTIWQSQINKKIVTVSPYEKLNKVFEKLQNNYCHFAIVQVKKRFLGIITLQNILNFLLGEMKDEREILLRLSN